MQLLNSIQQLCKVRLKKSRCLTLLENRKQAKLQRSNEALWANSLGKGTAVDLRKLVQQITLFDAEAKGKLTVFC